MKRLLMMLFSLMGFATFALAEEPAWYTSLNTQLVAILAMVVGVLGAVISIRVAPLAWKYISSVLRLS